MKEIAKHSLPGIPVLLTSLASGGAAVVAGIWLVRTLARGGSPVLPLACLLALAMLALVAIAGLYMVQPNQAAVLELFGKYTGTVKDNGLRWNNPFLEQAQGQLAGAQL